MGRHHYLWSYWDRVASCVGSGVAKMSRTPEEKATNKAIEAAIEAFRTAYHEAHPDSSMGTLVDWIVVAAEAIPDAKDPADDVTAYSIIMPGGAMPSYRARGLLEIGIQYLGMTEPD